MSDSPYISTPRARRRGQTIDCDAIDGSPWRAPVAVRALDLWEVWRLFVVQSTIAWIVPPFAWRHVAGGLGALNVLLHGRSVAKRLGSLRAILGNRPELPTPLQIEIGVSSGKYEERFQYLRAHRPGGWEPEIRIHGIEHIEAERQAGRGILFWGSSFAFHDLISKIALHRLELDVFHYTRPVHGLSDTRFGVRFLNPVRTSVELRYLAARVSAEEKIQEAMSVLQDEIKKGGAVSIKTGNRGRRRAAVPFLGGQLELATGAVALAERWGAALLPTFTLRRPDGSFDFIVGAPLASDEQDQERRAAGIVQRYADQLLPLVKAEPLQWRGWRFVLPPKSKN
jgi:lauroyl/myristoyl acyltransferase